jgi:hypothetical protein
MQTTSPVYSSSRFPNYRILAIVGWIGVLAGAALVNLPQLREAGIAAWITGVGAQIVSGILFFLDRRRQDEDKNRLGFG